MALIVNWTVDFLIYSITLGILLYVYVTRNFRYWKNKKVPYQKPLPFFGNSLDLCLLKTSIGEYFADVYHQSKDAFVGIFVFDQPCLVVRDPELIKSVLIKDFNSFYDRTVADNIKDDPMGSHILFVIKNPDWRAMRLKLTTVFTSGKMKNMFLLMNEVAEELKGFMEKTVGKCTVLEAREICGKFSTDVISSCAFGINAHCFQNENAEFRVVARRIFNWNSFIRGVSMTCYFVAPNLVRLLKMKFMDPFSATFLRTAFWDTISERKRTQQTRNDLIDTLLKIKEEECIEDIYKLESDKLVAQAAQFFIAGFETTSSTISYTLYELAKRPQVQEKLRNEINSILVNHKGITYEALKEMTYLEMCIQGARFGTLSSKLGVATIISSYRVEMCKGTPSKLKFDPKGFLLAPIKGIPLNFTKI